MTHETLRVCRDALYARLDAIDNDLRANRMDYYSKGDWRGELHRRRLAAEIVGIRRALREISFVEWGVRDAA